MKILRSYYWSSCLDLFFPDHCDKFEAKKSCEQRERIGVSL